MITILLIINIILFIILIVGLISLTKYIDEVCSNIAIRDNNFKQLINQFNKNVADILTILKLNDTLLKSNHSNINAFKDTIKEQTNKLTFINQDVQKSIETINNLILNKELNTYIKNKKHKKYRTPINSNKGSDFDLDVSNNINCKKPSNQNKV